MAFLAVLREGFETAVFLLATFHASGDATTSWLGAVIGILLAAAIGYGIYRGGVRLNLARFFRITGLVLVVVAAGLVMTALHTANEAGWLNAGQVQAFDLSWLVRPGTPVSSLFTGVLGIQPLPGVDRGDRLAGLPGADGVIVAWPAGRGRRRPARPAAPAAGRAVTVPGTAAPEPATATVRAPPRGGPRHRARTERTRRSADVRRRPIDPAGWPSPRGSRWPRRLRRLLRLVRLRRRRRTASGQASHGHDRASPRRAARPSRPRSRAGQVEFNVANKNAGAVSEAELRTGDLAKILGEQENLTPGPVRRLRARPPARHLQDQLPRRGPAALDAHRHRQGQRPAWQSNPQLAAAVSGYSSYIGQNTASLVTRTQAFCRAIDAGNMGQAKLLYPQARVFYERIEPVAEIWGNLDTDIDGRWENPVTVPSQFIGFHKIEQLLWADNTLAGASKLCAGLVSNEQQLLTLVRKRQYNPLEMASGATDLINEAATVEDQRRGGALLQHRPAGLPGQRGRGHGGRRPAAALPAAEGPQPAGPDPAAGRRGQPS